MKDSNQRIIELHKIAAHAHLAAAEQHGKGDHLSGHEASRIAMDHSTKAFELAQDVRREADKKAKK